MTLLRRLAGERRRAALFVSHDRCLERIADRTLWLDDGRIAPAHAARVGATIGATSS